MHIPMATFCRHLHPNRDPPHCFPLSPMGSDTQFSLFSNELYGLCR